MIRLAIVVMGACASQVAAQAPSLSSPLDCEIGENCFIQQYVDHDPAEDKSRDFACGAQANDGHTGTDFRVATWAEMRSGLPVLAVAPGVVRATRDGMPDIPQGQADSPAIDGRECGNAVVLDHEHGWQTTYCHLRKESLRVKSGDRLQAGAFLGDIGASGATEFPHVHLTLRHNEQVVDPFKPSNDSACGLQYESLWSTPPILEFGGLMRIGLTTRVPEFSEIKDGLATEPDLASSVPALVVWTFGYATQAGDQIRLAIEGPNGWAFEQQEALEKPQAQLFRAGGRRAPSGGLPIGLYTGVAELLRNDQAIERLEIRTELND